MLSFIRKLRLKRKNRANELIITALINATMGTQLRRDLDTDIIIRAINEFRVIADVLDRELNARSAVHL